MSITQKIFKLLRSDEWKKGGERFGIGVATAMAIMSAIALYRGEMARSETLAIVSASLLAAAFLAPFLLYPAAWLLEEAFKLSTKALLNVMLVLVFFLVFAPVGIALRILKKDPLDRKIMPDAESYWVKRKPHDPSRAEKQY